MRYFVLEHYFKNILEVFEVNGYDNGCTVVSKKENMDRIIVILRGEMHEVNEEDEICAKTTDDKHENNKEIIVVEKVATGEGNETIENIHESSANKGIKEDSENIIANANSKENDESYIKNSNFSKIIAKAGELYGDIYLKKESSK